MAMTWLQLFLDVPRARWEESLRFWSAATGWAVSPARGEDDQFVTLLPPHGTPWVKLQAIDTDARIHLDLDSRDRDGEIDRALAAGARPAWVYEDVTVMRSPGGLLFCHTLGSRLWGFNVEVFPSPPPPADPAERERLLAQLGAVFPHVLVVAGAARLQPD